MRARVMIAAGLVLVSCASGARVSRVDLNSPNDHDGRSHIGPMIRAPLTGHRTDERGDRDRDRNQDRDRDRGHYGDSDSR